MTDIYITLCCCKYQLFKDRKQITTAIITFRWCYRCCKYQLFKDRKQITTISISFSALSKLLQISVIQRSKANHNAETCGFNPLQLLQISVIQRSKANHNDGGPAQQGDGVVANISYSKIESKSQPGRMCPLHFASCCKYQLFKDRKQITTSSSR